MSARSRLRPPDPRPDNPRLPSFRSVFGARPLSILHTDRIQRASHDVITNARQILHSAASNQNHRVFLEIVSLSRNVRRDFKAVGQSNPSDFPQRRVRLFGCHRVNTGAHSPPLRRSHKRRRGRFASLLGSSSPNQLTNRRHRYRFEKRGGKIGKMAKNVKSIKRFLTCGGISQEECIRFSGMPSFRTQKHRVSERDRVNSKSARKGVGLMTSLSRPSSANNLTGSRETKRTQRNYVRSLEIITMPSPD